MLIVYSGEIHSTKFEKHMIAPVVLGPSVLGWAERPASAQVHQQKHICLRSSALHLLEMMHEYKYICYK